MILLDGDVDGLRVKKNLVDDGVDLLHVERSLFIVLLLKQQPFEAKNLHHYHPSTRHHLQVILGRLFN
jgi:hypothetical protein